MSNRRVRIGESVLLSALMILSVAGFHPLPYVFAQSPEILIEVSSVKPLYQIDEIARLDIEVTNNMEVSTTCYFGLSLRDPDGRVSVYDSQIGLTRGSASLMPGDSTSLSAEWRIQPSDYDDDVAEGSYDVAINCWKDSSFTDRHTDNLDFERIFRIVDDDDRSQTRIALDFAITIDSVNTLQRGESTDIRVEIENRRSETTLCYFGFSIRDPTGEFSVYDSQIVLSPTFSSIGIGETISFSANWLIPGDSPEGSYDVAVNCWRDESFTNRYTDNLIWEPAFQIGELDDS